MWPFLYNTFLFPLMIVLAYIASFNNKKIKDSLHGKQGLWDRLEKNLKNRDRSQPLIWFHVPSAGEFLQAEPVLERFLQKNFDCIVTFNSVSGEKWVKKGKISTKKQPLFID